MDLFGDDVGVHTVFVVNTYAYVLYWVLGTTFMLMENYETPKSLKNFKIQKKKEDLSKKKLFHVSHYKIDEWTVC